MSKRKLENLSDQPIDLKKSKKSKEDIELQGLPKDSIVQKKSQKKIELQDLPKDPMLLIGEFLKESDYQHTFLNHYFSLITLNWITEFYKRKYLYFTRQYDVVEKYSPNLLKELNDGRKLYRERYYTLYDPAYIELFILLEQEDSKAAQTFIELRLRKNQDLTDIIFTQKNAVGETVITLARRLNLQDFLDYCFQTLIINRPPLHPESPKRLVNTGSYADLLSELDSKMSNEALWTYACAYMCNQQDICKVLSSKSRWDIRFLGEKREPMSIVDAWLGSNEIWRAMLQRYYTDALEDEDGDEFLQQQWDAIPEYEKEVTHFKLNGDFTLAEVAALTKNRKMIEEFEAGDHGRTELLYYYLENKNLTFLNMYEDDENDEESSVFTCSAAPNSHYNVDSDEILLPIGLAIAKNWPKGVRCILDSGFSLIREQTTYYAFFLNSLSLAIDFGRTEIIKLLLRRGANPNGFADPENKQAAPIFHAIQKGKLEYVQLLVEHKASLDIENKADKTYRFPLVSAVLHGCSEITDYLVKTMDIPRALYQLENSVSFFQSRPRQKLLLEKFHSDLSKQQEAETTNFLKSLG
jgi:hypothetical protein